MVMHSPCPCCFGPIVDGQCRSCGVCIGTVKNASAKGRKPEARSLYEHSADQAGRSLFGEVRAAFDDGALRDEDDNNSTPGWALSHNYTEPPARRGVIADHSAEDRAIARWLEKKR